MLASCGTERSVQHEGEQSGGGMPAVAYSLVFIIHGDGEYLYHDSSGNPHFADEEAVSQAERVALHNVEAEVFIFHQRPRGRVLFLFPLRDGEMSYYRHGRLVATESYWRDPGQSGFDAELVLYRQYYAGNRNETTRMFLYCGHEVPEYGGAGYDRSSPDHVFTVSQLAGGLGEFVRQSGRIDLVVLSTCYGGTPYTIGAIGHSARYVIASPDNLHLSYFDFGFLERLERGLKNRAMRDFAKAFANRSFTRLVENVQTTVSVAVYDIDSTIAFLDSVRALYRHTLARMSAESPSTGIAVEKCDCGEIPEFTLPTMDRGVEVFYRPARFGRAKSKHSHSGWECLKESSEETDTTSAAAPEVK
jgi:hypothetical protein